MLSLLCDTARFILVILFFFFNDTATTEIYTLSLHDALPIFDGRRRTVRRQGPRRVGRDPGVGGSRQRREGRDRRSEEHTSELQSQSNLVCRLLLEKKKKKQERRNRMKGRSVAEDVE